MTDNLKREYLEDGNNINLTESWEVRYWTQKLKVSEEKLINVVGKVGVNSVDVENYLKKPVTV